MDDNNKIGTSLCLLSKIVTGTNLWEHYGSFITPNVPDGIYRLGLYSGADLMAMSNPVEVISNAANTVYVEFRHNKNFFGFNYSLLATDWYQQFRLRITEADRQTNDNRDQYRSITTNRLRNYDAHVDRYVKFETYYFDAEMHEAMEVMVSHDEIYINEKKFTVKEAYKRIVDAASKVSKGEFELWEDSFSIDQKFDNVSAQSLVKMYFNSGSYQKNDCGSGTGTYVEYPGLAGKYCSTVSQEAAESQVTAAELALAQAYANAHGSCSQAALFTDNFDNWSGGMPVLWVMWAYSQHPETFVNDSNRASFNSVDGAWNTAQQIYQAFAWDPLTIPPGMTRMRLNIKIKIEDLSSGDQVVVGIDDSPGEDAPGRLSSLNYFNTNGEFIQQAIVSPYFTNLKLFLSILNPTGPHTAKVDYLIIEFIEFLP
jgi:hypothetical protein